VEANRHVTYLSKILIRSSTTLKLTKKKDKEKIWHNMPAGKYLIYPLEADKLYIRWWQ